MYRGLLLFVFICAYCWCVCVDGRVCKSMDIRSRGEQFSKLRGCTEIAGYLKIVLLENVKEFPTFPELVEIRDYLLLYHVYHLKSLGQLFPNLSTIRGKQTFHIYSLVIFSNPHMQEVGLSKLLHIQKGGVKIDKCPKLCYVRTVNWTLLGVTVFDFTERKTCGKEICKDDCRGNCWNSEQCQILQTECHQECLGCKKANSSSDCISCLNYKDKDDCVTFCPKEKFIDEDVSLCLTEEECKTRSPNVTSWTFRRNCISKCPLGYEMKNELPSDCQLCVDGICKKRCNATVIESNEDAMRLAGCTHIESSLEIRVSSYFSTIQLKENLGLIQHIQGCLKIARTTMISSLDFLSNLRVIEGANCTQKYPLFVYQNQNLQQLWNFTSPSFNLTIKRGMLAFHNNPLLCLSEIYTLADLTGLRKDMTPYDVSEISNGDKTSCVEINLKVTLTEINSTNVTMRWDFPAKNNQSVIGYLVHYTLNPNTTKNSVFDSNDACNDRGWFVVFVSNNTALLTNLQPFSVYKYYILIYNTSSTLHGGGTSELMEFRTASDDPSQPLNFEVIATSSSKVKLKWDLPALANGNLSHYVILAMLEKDEPKFVDKRNYCQNPHVLDAGKRAMRGRYQNPNNTGDCVCTTLMMVDSVTPCGPFDDPDGFYPGINRCDKFSYHLADTYGSSQANPMKIEKRVPALSKSVKKTHMKNHNQSLIEAFPDATSNATSYELQNLRHFSVYIVLFSVCNSPDEYHKGPLKCSGVLFRSVRTKKNETADNIGKLTVRMESNEPHLYWKEPKNPNGFVVSYHIEYRIVTETSNISNFHRNCITSKQFKNSNLNYHLSNINPGTYEVRVQAVSLAGPGSYSTIETFQITPQSNLWVVYLLVSLLFLFIVVSIIVYYRYKKKHEFDDMHLITSINPDYEGPMYLEDKWELERDDVELFNVLGQGTFGLVYNGNIRSKGLPCAVKTVNESASAHYRLEFLNEASVMKAFSEAHHVIKLMGVVSRGQPPLVVMELMERGDLKSFLRNSRDSSQNVTCNEMYQMAAQVADGMAYLTAKKFVHRDLAARNCMVASDYTVKIGDFGMTRDIYETDYYRKGTKGLLPVRWMAPESLADGIFTSDSDVWSYGIVLWEMATLAEQPYQGLTNEQVLSFIIAKGTLGRPSQCPDILYDIMEACWFWRPTERPLFTDIVERLESLAGQAFTLVSFYHSREGEEHRINARDRNNAIVAAREGVVGHYKVTEEQVNLVPADSRRLFAPLSVPRPSAFDAHSDSWDSSYSLSNATL